MGFRILADATVVVHFGFLGYVVAGGFLAWRHPRLLWPHLAAALWGLLIITLGQECPLTYLENWAREHAGQPPLPHSGFIDHYVEGVLYPARYTRLLQLLAATTVLISWTVPLHRRLTHHATGPTETTK